MVHLNVLAIQIGMVQQQVSTLVEQIKRHQTAEAAKDGGGDRDVLRAFGHAIGTLGLGTAEAVLVSAVEELRHVGKLRRIASDDAATLRQVEARA